MKSILCLGEVSWDHLYVVDQLPADQRDGNLVFESAAPGGSALNTVCVLKRLNSNVVLVGNILGQDFKGENIIKYLKSKNINSRLVVAHDLETPACHVFVEEKSGKRSFIISHKDIQVYRQEQLGTLIEETRSGFFSHLFVQTYLKELSRHFLEAVQDVTGIWILTQDLPADSEFVRLCDAVQISLPEDGELGAATLKSVSEKYFRGRCRTVFVTAGSKGVGFCESGSKPAIFPGLRSASVKDTTGCGDAFRAGLMKALSDGLSMEEAIQSGQEQALSKAGVYGSHF